MAAAITALELEARHVADDLDQLELAVAALRDRWSGEAQAAYDAAQSQWAIGMRGINGVLRRAAQGCQASHDAYTAAYNRMNQGLL